jgi:hypothetical protein
MAEGRYGCALGQSFSMSGSPMPTSAPMTMAISAVVRQVVDALREQVGDGLPHVRRGRVEGFERLFVRHHQIPGGHHGDDAEEHAVKLREKLAARVRAEQIAAFQVGQQIRRRAGSRRRGAGGHEVDGGDAFGAGQHGVKQLRDLAHRADRRGVRLARRAAGHERHDKRKRHGNQPQPHGDVKREVLHDDEADRDRDEADEQPGVGHLDGFGGIVNRGAFVFFENHEGAEDRPPVQATCMRLEKTMMDVPPHSAQRTGLKSPRH